MAMLVNDKVINAEKDNLIKIKKSLDSSVKSMNDTIKSIKKNWQSDASTNLCNNISKSLTSFQSYIDVLTNVSTYMEDFVATVNKTKGS